MVIFVGSNHIWHDISRFGPSSHSFVFTHTTHTMQVKGLVPIIETLEHPFYEKKNLGKFKMRLPQCFPTFKIERFKNSWNFKMRLPQYLQRI